MGTISLNFYLRETCAWFNKKHYFWGAWLAVETNSYDSVFKFSHCRGCRNIFIIASTNCSHQKPYFYKENKSNELSQLIRQVVWVHTGDTTSKLTLSLIFIQMFGVEKSQPGLFQSSICLCMLQVNFYLSN